MMLILTRKLGQTICIGDDVQVELVDVNPGAVRLGITAPRDVPIVREELVGPGGVPGKGKEGGADAAV